MTTDSVAAKLSSEQSSQVEIKKDYNGYPMIRGKCKACKKCWIYLLHPELKGQCIYGGPFGENEKQEDTRHFESPKEGTLSEMPF